MSSVCPKCNNVVPDGTIFCTKCGSKITGNLNGSGVNNSGGMNNGRTTYFNVSEKYKELLIDPNERVIAGLGDSVVKTMASGSGIGSNKIFFTDRRFYAKTNHFSFKYGLGTNKFIVSIRDITGVHIVHKNPIQWLILAGICLLATMFNVIAISGVVLCAIVYFITKGTYLRIAYPGATTELSVKMYSLNTVSDFQKKIISTINK